MEINLWDFIYEIYIFFVEVMEFLFNLWNYTFEIGDRTIAFKSILTTSLIVVMGLLLVKKLIPVA